MLNKKIKGVLKKALIIVVIISLLIFGTILEEIHREKITNEKIVNNTIIIRQEMEEKQKTINELNNKIKKLQEKQKELEKAIEKVKISKVETRKIVTSRGSSSSATKKNVTTTKTNGKWIWANVSAYCACVKCCGKTNGITASGKKAKINHTIAAPSTYKFGTKIEIEGMGIYTVEDRGGAITGNKLDIYFNNHSAALKFGRRNLQIRVVE